MGTLSYPQTLHQLQITNYQLQINLSPLRRAEVKHARQAMAKVILAPFIQSISGKVGNLEFRTLKSGKTVVRARHEDDYLPTAPPTEKALAQRRRFGVISSVVGNIQQNYDRIDKAALDRKKIWQKVSYLYAKYFESIDNDRQLIAKLLEEYYR